MLATVGKSKNKLISDVFLWTPADGQASVGWLTKIYIHTTFNEKKKKNLMWKDIFATYIELNQLLPFHVRGDFWPGMVAPYRVMSMGQIELLDI